MKPSTSGVVKGMCEALGIKGIAKEMEKVKHLETRTLWAQDKIDEGKVEVKKIGGDRNVADILTKNFSSSRLPTSQSQSWKEGVHWPHSCR